MSIARPLIVGEVLFDEFADTGELFLGGAPFNIAWNLSGFGLNPLFVSRVGDDKEARLVFERMESWSMDISGLQIDSTYGTGRVLVNLSADSHSFDILDDMAYDFIDREPILSLLEDNELSLLYHGTLVSRARVSCNTLDYIVSFSSLPVFVDINLRKPHWNYSKLRNLLSGIKWLKLNDEEFKELIKAVDLGPIDSFLVEETMIKLSGELMSLYPGLELLVLTLGNRGAILCSRDDVFHKKPYLSSNVVDTVGAGDAFSSVVLLGITMSWDFSVILDRALDFASMVCGIKGALCKDKSVYLKFKESWGLV